MNITKELLEKCEIDKQFMENLIFQESQEVIRKLEQEALSRKEILKRIKNALDLPAAYTADDLGAYKVLLDDLSAYEVLLVDIFEKIKVTIAILEKNINCIRSKWNDKNKN
jgi:23S rRNA G2069 N7-methylase RlmK/C1962 C5-methylase RlmI